MLEPCTTNQVAVRNPSRRRKRPGASSAAVTWCVVLFALCQILALSGAEAAAWRGMGSWKAGQQRGGRRPEDPDDDGMDEALRALEREQVLLSTLEHELV